MKYFFDSLWGPIKVSPLMLKIIDTQEFQRLKYMTQLGSSRFVYPSANGDRFSHSLGVCYLTRKVCKHISKLYPDLMTSRKIELLCVASLIHDIGHGPFSHVFDYICENKDTPMKFHENRSKWIFKYMVKKYNIPINKNEILFICGVIDPHETLSKYNWDYQIISGTVDTDRLDYILRDSLNSGIPVSLNTHQVKMLIKMMKIKENCIVFDTKAVYIIKNLLNARKDMFEILYRHKTAVVVDDMLKDVILGVQELPEYNLDNILSNVEHFLMLDDSLLRQIYYNPKVNKCIKNIIDNIYTRNFYKQKSNYKYKKIDFNVKFIENVDKELFSGLIK